MVSPGNSQTPPAKTRISIKVPLYVHKGKGPFLFTIRGIQPLSDTLNDHIKGIPTDLDTVIIWRLNFGRSQANYHLYKTGKITLKRYQTLVNQFKLDTTLNKTNYKSYAFIYTGTKANRRFFSFDTNLNQSFNDEIQFSYDTTLSVTRFRSHPDSLVSMPIEFEIVNNGKVSKRKKHINVIPVDRSYKYANKTLTALHMPVGINEHKKGDFNIGKDVFQVALSSAYEDDQLAEITIGKQLSNQPINSDNPLFEVGDSLIVNNYLLKIESLSRWTDTLYLSAVPYKKPLIGFRVGNTAPDLSLATDIFGKKISSSDKKLRLLDFWGTWCIPCIKAIPELKEIKTLFGDKLTVISVAYENTNDTTKVAQIIHEQKMDWYHLLENSKEKSTNSLVNRLRIEAFPTTILLDANNKIIMRKTGIAGVKEELQRLLK